MSITIGNHDLQCMGSTRLSRYYHKGTKKFDGVNLFGSNGSKDYTSSVLNILKGAGIISQEYILRGLQSSQSCLNQVRKPQVPQPAFKLPISNRYDVLQEQGN